MSNKNFKLHDSESHLSSDHNYHTSREITVFDILKNKVITNVKVNYLKLRYGILQVAHYSYIFHLSSNDGSQIVFLKFSLESV
jgi:hypothetical protein